MKKSGQKQKKKVLYTIKGKKFYSLDGMPLPELKKHAEWIHPDLHEFCNLSENDKIFMKGIAGERQFQNLVDKLSDFKPLTKKEKKLAEKYYGTPLRLPFFDEELADSSSE